MEKEKVKITSIINEGEKTSKAGKKYTLFQISLADGRKGNGLGDEFKDVKEGQEIEITVKESEYNGSKQYTFFPVKAEMGGNNKFPTKNYAFDKRRVALECSVKSLEGGICPEDEILKRAELFHAFLNK